MGFACWVAELTCIQIVLGCYFQSKWLFKLAIFSQITALIFWIVGVAVHFIYELNSTWHTNLPWSRYDAKIFVIRLHLIPAILWSGFSIFFATHLIKLIDRVKKWKELQASH
eukprot:TRINITY_DN5013_c0_g1_i2.p1 TRINITY_DN5013_c0_g1~~TRINITY_DN5013_c0_g1_i2.p1  ORF type:complete len:112 (-),score=11.88 TRINITY_DN5013_c0_g1_i2:109-444(-)